MHQMIAILGDYDPTFMPHTYTDAALSHSANAMQCHLRTTWFRSDKLEDGTHQPSAYDGYVIGPGRPGHPDAARSNRGALGR